VVALAEGLIPLPDAVDFVQGATATDSVQTAYGAVMGAGKLRPGERTGIIGLGGLGLTGARIAVIAGAKVYAAEPNRAVAAGRLPGCDRGCRACARVEKGSAST
jgi:alcohol dehydrogenase, propanol-preferring